MKYTFTDQQDLILNTMADPNLNKIVMVKARAGCGKTSTSLAVVDRLKPNKGLYTAFNKAIVASGADKFTSNIDCKTLHALAYSYVRPKLNIEDFTYLCIKEKLSYPNKAIIINAIDDFYRSSSVDMYTYMEDVLEDYPKLIEVALKYINLMIEDKVNPTFNFLLKYFHLLLYEGQITVKYDLVIFDEIQDSTGVALEIFKLINSTKKLGLGDPHQSIYGFMNLVNGFDILDDTLELELYKSFRCSSIIANKVDDFGKQWLSKDFIFKGNEKPKDNGLTAYITATNAAIIYRINSLHRDGLGYILTRPIKDIFAAPLALVTAASGKEVFHKKYKFLEKEYVNYTMSGYKTFFSYLSNEVNDDEIKSAVDLLTKFKATGINIFDVLADAKKAKKDPSITCGTFFSLKGLEYGTVYIESDLNIMIGKLIEKGGPEKDSELTTFKGYYVSCTRAQVHLHGAVHL